MPLYLEICFVILAIISLCIILRLPTKRLLLVMKIKYIAKKQGYDVKVNHTFRSLFKRGSEPDIVIKTENDLYRVFILTTRYKNSRYHFDDLNTVKIFTKYTTYLRIRSATASSYAGRNLESFPLFEHHKKTVKSFNIEPSEIEIQNILLINPVPLDITANRKTELVHLWDGDEIYDGVKFYSGGGFRELIERK